MRIFVFDPYCFELFINSVLSIKLIILCYLRIIPIVFLHIIYWMIMCFVPDSNIYVKRLFHVFNHKCWKLLVTIQKYEFMSIFDYNLIILIFKCIIILYWEVAIIDFAKMKRLCIGRYLQENKIMFNWLIRNYSKDNLMNLNNSIGLF